MKYIHTNKAPAAIGPYSQAVSLGDLVFTSGQIALRVDGSFNDGDIKEQSTQVLQNLENVLKEGGSSLSNVIKTTIYLASMDDFASVNEVYGSFFGDHKPARSTIAVKTLPKNALVEIEAIAQKAK
ncbi:MAG: Deaminase [uncultured Campylobacterales bacterium]|uniref:Deaminase n=1 Tax=uncultured Campylobacterales bacterium TaxID=352960 RepID=A0A6S6SHN6_9BACT|nr:MAG: Deaminase [uncultured Campylobacterales bacterium]